MNRISSPPVRYLIAVLLVAAALTVRLAMVPWIGLQYPFLTFFVAVMAAAWCGGLGPGLTASALSILVADYFLIEPLHQLPPPHEAILPLFIFGLEVAAVSYLAEQGRRKEAALAESREQFRLLSDTVPALMSYVDTDKRYRFCNRTYTEWFALPLERIIGQHMSSVLGEKAWTTIGPRVDEALTGQVVEYEAEISYARVGARWVHCVYTPHRNMAGQVMGVIVLVTDITARKQGETALRESHERYELVLEGAEAAIWDWDVPREKVVFSSRWKSLRGFSDEEVSDALEEWTKGVHPDDAPRVMTAVQAYLDGKTPCFKEEYRVCRKDGTWIWVADSGLARRDADGQVLRMAGAEVDITQRKQAEEALRMSEERFRGIVDQAIAGISETDLAGRFVEANSRFAEMVGRTAADLSKLRMQDITHPDDLPGNVHQFLALVEGRGGAFVIEKRYLRPDGSAIWVNNSVSLLRDPDGHPKGVVAVSIDITARKQAEEALKRSEERYRYLYDAMDEGFCVIEALSDQESAPADYLFLEINPAFERQTGIKQARGRRMREIAPGLEQHWFDLYGQIVKTGTSQRFEYPAAELNRWYEGYAYPLGERRLGIIFNDITERKRSEEAARRLTLELEARVAERTSALVHSHRQLRALAKELNLAEHRERKRLAVELHDHLAQLLVLARLKLGQAKRLPGLSSPGADLFTEMQGVLSEALAYTRTLVADLSPPVLYEFGLVAALKWLAQRMQTHHCHVMLAVDHDLHPPLPEEQAVLLFQSVRELLMNVIKHGKVDQATITIRQEKSELVIEVQDRGTGFDPTLSAATGLSAGAGSSQFGLFSIRERMAALGGTFEIDSAPGHGTTALLRIPLEEQGAPEDLRRRPVQVGSAGHAEPIPLLSSGIRVLLVDDHAMVRQGLRSVLESYPDIEVIGEASNGQEAVEHTEQFMPSVIVMDINMPIMSGIEATAKIKQRHPDMIVIGLSVNASSDNQDAMRTAGAAVLLTKEAAVERLYQSIQDAMRPLSGDPT